MKAIHMVGKIINGFLRKFGYELLPANKNISMASVLSRRAECGLKINSVIDIGASNGSWSKMARQYFPNAFYMLIEANDVHTQDLLNFKSQYPNVDYIVAAAGDSIGEIYFDANDPFGGQASHSLHSQNYITVPMTTVDEQVKQKFLHPPFLLKLDTHGFEAPILKGAQDTLKKTDLIIIETYNFKLTPDSLKFWEMCSHMEEYGFRPIDLCDPLHRPKDHAFWQMDIFFVPGTNREFRSNTYL